jgi:ribosomal-protein-alanine N-acetyltransferase
MPDRLPYRIEPMALTDLDQVMAIEEVAFSTPWSRRAYRYEVEENEHSTMLVMRPAPEPGGPLGHWLRRPTPGRVGPVLGYAGFWLLVDDAHVSTIAVHPDWRGRHLGELLLLSLLEQGAARGARRATLEVRVSNLAAQGLYDKYGFEILTRRKRYYADNNEDAYIMATPDFGTVAFRANLRRRRLALRRQLLAGLPPRQEGID